MIAFAAGFGQDPLAHADRPDRVVAARRRRPRLRRRLARPRLRARRARPAACAGRSRASGRIKGALALSGNRLYVGTYDDYLYALDATHRQADLARALAGPARRPRPVLLDAGGRLRPRLHRLDRRQGLLVRRHEREAALVAGHRRLRLLLAGGLAQDGLRRLLQRPLLRVRRGDRRRALAVRRERRRSPARPTMIDGVVYFSTLKGRTFALDARNGKLLWTFPDGKYAAVVADRERLYLVGYTRVYRPTAVVREVESPREHDPHSPARSRRRAGGRPPLASGTAIAARWWLPVARARRSVS